LGAPGFLVRDPFDTAEAVKAFDGPLLVLHGEFDDIIPPKHGRQLAAVGNGELHLLPCGHNDCPRSWDLVLEFLVTHEIVAPDIQR
jgi:pimeloyl-ACP methyl ester carboxylesterase